MMSETRTMSDLTCLNDDTRYHLPLTSHPNLHWIYTALVTIGPIEEVGQRPEGLQRIIPITGGRFRGPRLQGSIIPGGMDWNLHRTDGTSLVEASYFMRCDDGVVIKITNCGVNIRPLPDMPRLRPSFTTPVFAAPAGAYEFLNQGVFVGTLEPVPGESAVRIGVFQVG